MSVIKSSLSVKAPLVSCRSAIYEEFLLGNFSDLNPLLVVWIMLIESIQYSSAEFMVPRLHRNMSFNFMNSFIL